MKFSKIIKKVLLVLALFLTYADRDIYLLRATSEDNGGDEKERRYRSVL